MLDIKLIRKKPDWVRERLKSRGGQDATKIDKLLEKDEARRNVLSQLEQLKSTRNRVSKEIGTLIGQKRREEADKKKAEMKELGDRINLLEELKDEGLKAIEAARASILLEIPNLPHDTVPLGKDSADNKVVRTWG